MHELKENDKLLMSPLIISMIENFKEKTIQAEM